jgi:fructokinase
MRIGVDLGGTKIEGVVLAEDGVELKRRRIATPRDDYQMTLAAVADLVRQLERDAGAVESIGVGHPGAISPATGLIKNANSTWLNGRPFGSDLSRRLNRRIEFANDADCFALSEAIDGAATGAEVVFGVIVGTGTGGGVVIGGRLLAGANAIAGEWGHNPMPWPRPDEWPGPRCYCGRTGCIEMFLSGPALARDYESAGGTPISGVEISARAAAGESLAIACLDRYANRMARALASVINVLDPNVIALGGGLSNIDQLYRRVPKLWSEFVFSDSVVTRLVRPAHGDASGVRGAAWLSRR